MQYRVYKEVDDFKTALNPAMKFFINIDYLDI